MKPLHKVFCLFTVLLFATCDIKDDLPYPIVRGVITEFEVEGQCAFDGSKNYSTTIDKNTRTITLYVCDTIDLSKVRINKIALASTTKNPDINYTDPIQLIPDANVCADYANFPKESFDSLVAGQDTRVDFTQPVKFIVRTFQDYIWTVKISRGVKREIKVENQVGNAVIDPYLCNAIIYVNKTQRLDNLKVLTFTLGGEHGSVNPDPTQEETYDFRNVREFEVTTGWGEIQTWHVVAHQAESTIQATANAWSNFAILEASLPTENEGIQKSSLAIQWRQSGSSEWNDITNDALSVDSLNNVKATLRGLTPNTTYEYRLLNVKNDTTTVGEPVTFTTEDQTPLYNGGFENWWMSGKVAYPTEQGVSFWDTSNPGSASFGGSNTTETTEVVHGGNKAAMLQSKYIVVKFAAASLYTGSFGNLIGTSGASLNWGVPFTARPTALTGYMQYDPVAINRVGKNLPPDAPVLGESDQCGIYCALLSEALAVDNTNMSTFPDWETDPRIIAYGALPAEQNVDSNGKWERVVIPFIYRDLNRRPTHLLVVFSASKYGDYFHGGEGSTLYIDEFAFEYGDNPSVK